MAHHAVMPELPAVHATHNAPLAARQLNLNDGVSLADPGQRGSRGGLSTRREAGQADRDHEG